MTFSLIQFKKVRANRAFIYRPNFFKISNIQFICNKAFSTIEYVKG